MVKFEKKAKLRKDFTMKKAAFYASLGLAFLASFLFQGCTTSRPKPLPNQIGQASTSVVPMTWSFPPPPAGLTNFPTIGRPIIVASRKIVSSFGGQQVTNMARDDITMLLDGSHRFLVTLGSTPQCKCQVKLYPLQLQETTITNGIILWIWKHLHNLIFKPNVFTNVDWEDIHSVVKVHCEVNVMIYQSKYQILLADSDGNVSETNTAKNLEIKLAGYSKRMNDEQMNDNFIKLATYNALTNMLPQLDPELLKLSHSSTKTIAGANI